MTVYLIGCRGTSDLRMHRDYGVPHGSHPPEPSPSVPYLSIIPSDVASLCFVGLPAAETQISVDVL
jgi:hypothetical protein